MLNRRRPCTLVRGCTALLASTVLLTGCGGNAPDIVQATYSTNGSPRCRPGVTFYTGFGGFATTSDHPVPVTDVRIVGADPGLRVVGVYAVSKRDGQSQIGLITEAHVKLYRQPQTFFPPSRAVLYPRNQPPQWYFLIEVRGTRTGDLWTSGLEVTDASGSQQFPDRVHVPVVSEEPHPSECPADL